MSSKYTYLETNTDYSSEELSLRLDDVASANKGLNAIDLSSLSSGCFRSNLIPRMIHSSSLPGTINKNLFSVERNVKFRNVNRVIAHSFSPSPWPSGIIQRLEYTDPEDQYELDMSDTGKQNVGAVIVLANVCVERFAIENSGEESDSTKYAPNEDVDFAEFFIRVTTDDPFADRIEINRSKRSLSPRVTISRKEDPRYTGLNTKYPVIPDPETFNPASTARGDVQTFQDVSIRCVILPSDIPEGTKIFRIDLELGDVNPDEGFTGRLPSAIFISKANLTAIPIHTKVS